MQETIDCLQEELKSRGKEIAQLESALFVVWKKTQQDFLPKGQTVNRSSSAEPSLSRFTAAARLWGNSAAEPSSSNRPPPAQLDPLPRDALRPREDDPHGRLLRRLFPPIVAPPENLLVEGDELIEGLLPPRLVPRVLETKPVAPCAAQSSHTSPASPPCRKQAAYSLASLYPSLYLWARTPLYT
jgi:hypothetical protein